MSTTSYPGSSASSVKEIEINVTIIEVIQMNKFAIAKMDEDHYDITEEQLKKGNLSMSLYNPTIKDSGTYTCHVDTDEGRRIIASIEVHVPAQVTESRIVVNQAQDSIILPCFSEPWKSDVNNWLSWKFSSSDKEREIYHTIIEVIQMGLIAIARMNEDHYDITEEQLKKGNLSMSLYNPTIEDSGTYTCNVGADEGWKIIASVEVHVPVIDHKIPQKEESSYPHSWVDDVD
uniref:Ig-like domain-containing protein n=1 Tax=Eptatretus burgeri TaxID=7764 RepID=A0A8C4Q0R4_EPTBU